MKTITKTIAFAFFALLLTSCTTTYYQVYKAKPIDNFTTTDSNLVYEDDNCKVSYNLWGDGGDVGFEFYNKTNEEIFVNLEESFFIVNGVAHDYYKKRIFTKSASSGATSSKSISTSKSVTGINYLNLIQNNIIEASASTGQVSSSGYSTAYYEQNVLHIPAKTSKFISEYSINERLYRDCDLFKYPTKSQIKTKSFSKVDSPIVFSNRISYTVGRSAEPIKFVNEFYVTEVTNYPEGEIIESKGSEYCGEKSVTKRKYFKDVSPDKFYIRYPKVNEKFKH
ncbi:hypothetical protein EI546_01905 [Aequorivita sp. H23M31]|uniref:Lipoprotein n=1 Tax=Aequorivita ciconiae TaxID=2494375 RepID=A0A410FZW0_9FLAO|nr:hypothetical protein [Aequorivita sp. H23M31]QAA80558.1 hypothetical protein EI546_01905 [Aequorivita sp. H23M31]